MNDAKPLNDFFGLKPLVIGLAGKPRAEARGYVLAYAPLAVWFYFHHDELLLRSSNRTSGIVEKLQSVKQTRSHNILPWPGSINYCHNLQVVDLIRPTIRASAQLITRSQYALRKKPRNRALSHHGRGGIRPAPLLPCPVLRRDHQNRCADDDAHYPEKRDRFLWRGRKR